MFRVSVRGFAVLVAGVATLFATTAIDRPATSFMTEGLVPVASAQAACARPTMGTEDAILTAAEGFMIDGDNADIFGYARLQRVEGDFARVVVIPRIQTDHARLFLQKDKTGTWKVIAGPGTGFAPDDVPGAPRAIFESCP